MMIFLLMLSKIPHHQFLRHIFNLSLEKGIFPDQLNIAKVTLLFKKGDNALMDNYRPILVLPCFSNVKERIIYNRLYSFFSENNTLYKKQFGFRKQHSTDHAIVHLVNESLVNESLLKITAIL